MNNLVRPTGWNENHSILFPDETERKTDLHASGLSPIFYVQTNKKEMAGKFFKLTKEMSCMCFQTKKINILCVFKLTNLYPVCFKTNQKKCSVPSLFKLTEKSRPACKHGVRPGPCPNRCRASDNTGLESSSSWGKEKNNNQSKWFS